jgi:heavy metal sensor kinase
LTARGVSIRLRLTAWYFLSLVAVLGALAAGSYFALRASLHHAIDDGLRYDILGVQSFFESRPGRTPAQLREELSRGPNPQLGGGLFQVFGDRGELLYQSPGLTRHGFPAVPPDVSGDSAHFRDAGPEGWPVRFGSQRARVAGESFLIEVAEPLRAFHASLRDYSRFLLLFTPVLIVAASGVGYWLSGRALAPVHRIIADARAIDPGHLSERLSVPQVRDELYQLTQTLNAMLERIERAVTRIGQFTADASHELRAPVALIHAAAEHSLRRERSRDELLEAMNTVLRESTRTAGLVDDLLLMARADSSAEEARPIPADLAAIVREVSERARGLAAARGIQLAADLGDGEALVMGEPALLHRLVLILVDNALKYTPEGGDVRLLLRSTGDHAAIDVIDSGVGIGAEDVPRIFDRFWRADRARSRGAGGSGLGLSIARSIVDRSGGTLTVESEPGRGSTFRVRLPRLRS